MINISSSAELNRSTVPFLLFFNVIFFERGEILRGCVVELRVGDVDSYRLQQRAVAEAKYLALGFNYGNNLLRGCNRVVVAWYVEYEWLRERESI